MRPVAQGRPGTQVIPDGWEAAHQPVATGTMTARCNLREPGTTLTWNTETEQNDITPHPAYATDVVCRVQALTNDAQTADAAEQTVTVAGYLVTVPATTTGVAVGHLVDVTTSNDELLTGRALRVNSVVRGSLLFERDLFCTLS